MNKLLSFVLIALVAFSASAVNLAGEYIFKGLDVINGNINKSSKVTIKEGATADTYVITGILPKSNHDVTATLVDGKLVVPQSQVVYSTDTYKAMLEVGDATVSTDIILTIGEDGTISFPSNYAVASMIREGDNLNHAVEGFYNVSLLPVNGKITSNVARQDDRFEETFDLGVTFTYDSNGNPTGGIVAGFDGVTWLAFKVGADNKVTFTSANIYKVLPGHVSAEPIEFNNGDVYDKGLTGVLDMENGKIIIDKNWCLAEIAEGGTYHYLNSFKFNSEISFNLNREDPNGIAGEYIFKALDVLNGNINKSSKVTFKMGTAPNSYVITGILPKSNHDVTATLVDGKLIVPQSQVVYSTDTYKAMLEVGDATVSTDIILTIGEDGTISFPSNYAVASMIREGENLNYAVEGFYNVSLLPVNGDITSDVVREQDRFTETFPLGVTFNFDDNGNPTGGIVAGFDGVAWLPFTVGADNKVTFPSANIYKVLPGHVSANPIEFNQSDAYDKGLTGVLDMAAGKIYINKNWCLAEIAENGTYHYLNSFKFSSVITFKGIVPPPVHIPGDVNLSGVVDVVDLNIVCDILLGFDQAENYDGRADLNKDGIVDIIDVNMILAIMLHED